MSETPLQVPIVRRTGKFYRHSYHLPAYRQLFTGKKISCSRFCVYEASFPGIFDSQSVRKECCKP